MAGNDGDGRLSRLFLEYITVLERYADQFVVIGGWAPYLYARLYGWNDVIPPLQTTDFDLSVMREFMDKLPSINETILNAGFEYNFKSLDTPTAVNYVKRGSEFSEALEIEFVTQSAHDGESVVKIGSLDIVALPYIDLLNGYSRTIGLDDLGFGEPGYIKIPEPGAFVLHKLLVSPLRLSKNKRDKDLYYAFYVLDSFERWQPEILRTISEICSSHPNYGRAAAELMEELFGDEDAAGIGSIVRQKPPTAFSETNEEQFKQYALYTMRKARNALEQEPPS